MNVFSKRIDRLPPYMFGKLKQLTYERRTQGVDSIDLGMGNPNDPTPQPIVDKLCDAAQDPRTHRYSASKGIFNLRREICRYYQSRFGVTLDPETDAVSDI